ncbi:barstar family protein [Micromonospora sp. WMMD1128]|uniref:barstar family protein n=1 Tax=unclassified Micromonospora TaxID=2617518 RepID=UPI00248BFF0E|nr:MULTISPECIES: barstar family protein [unclassified Micromonospora]WBB76215.1 barstar family protein [Micromonospora sp. WMMD1128]WFE36000.1 barstar family protein [Micromonospora sp. WMMD975]
MGAASPQPPAWLTLDPDSAPEPAGVPVPGAATRTRAALHDTLAVAMSLPDWYGRNWDALADALADVLTDRIGPDPLTLVVRDAANLLADEPPAQLGTFLDVLGAAAAGGHASLRLVLRDTPERLSALRDRIAAALGGHVGAPEAT